MAREATIEIEYIGKELSVNHYLGGGRHGGCYVKPEVVAWKAELGWTVKELALDDWDLPLSITCSGRFKDKRSQPDLSNLSKVVMDAIEDVTNLNDRDFRWHDGTAEYGKPPVLWIKIEESE